MGANSFLYEMTPICIGGNNENDRVASPESVPIHLKENFMACFFMYNTAAAKALLSPRVKTSPRVCKLTISANTMSIQPGIFPK